MIGIRSLLAAFAVAACVVAPAMADDIVSTWGEVKMPPPPALKPVKIDPASTALLVLDFDKNTCNQEKRPRCANSLPIIAKLIADARAHGATVAYSATPYGKVEDVPAGLEARPGETVVRAGVDKFLGTELEAALKARNIKTVIVTGTSAHGAALYTASAAAMRGFSVVFPVDGMSSVAPHVTLTRSSMIGW
jgi:nicotinamidase-related amidase